jgi:hypothetical protein
LINIFTTGAIIKAWAIRVIAPLLSIFVVGIIAPVVKYSNPDVGALLAAP